MPPPVICLLDGESPLTSAALHLLAQRDVQVIVGHSALADAERLRHLGPCGHTHAYPDPHDPAADFAAELIEWLDAERPDAVLPLSLATALAVCPAAGTLSAAGVAIAAPSLAALEAVLDRAFLWSFAQGAGLAVPQIQEIGPGDPRALLERFARLPALVPAEITAHHGAVRISTAADAAAAAATIQRRTGKPPLLVESIPCQAGWIAVTALCDTPGGVMACATETWTGWDAAQGRPRLRRLDEQPRAVEAALRLLRALEWTGPATVQFALDVRDGWPKLMQVWPGLTRGLSLAARGGIDLIWPLVEWALEHAPSTPERHRTGLSAPWCGDEAPWIFTPPADQAGLGEPESTHPADAG